jgi:predicted transcriptional regulator
MEKHIEAGYICFKLKKLNRQIQIGQYLNVPVNNSIQRGRVFKIKHNENNSVIYVQLSPKILGELLFSLDINEDNFHERLTPIKPVEISNEITTKVQSNLKTLVKFVENTHTAVTTKATDDIVLVNKLFTESYDSVLALADQTVGYLVRYTDEQIHTFIVTVVAKVSEELTPILEQITDSWNLYWKERVINTVKDRGFDFEKSKAVVIKIKKQFPTESNYQISERFITEKSFFITGVGLVNLGISSIPKVGPIITVISNKYLPFMQIPGLINEMIYQIAYIYGHDYCETDAFLIYNLVFSKAILMKLSLGFLTKTLGYDLEKTDISTSEINAITNILLSMTIGYATREFYENKTKSLIAEDVKEFKKLSRNVEKYVDVLVTGKDEITESFAQFMSDTQPLMEASTAAI